MSVLSSTIETPKTGASFARGKSKQDWGTPPEFVKAVEARFGRIDFDLAANHSNSLAANYYTEEHDSLTLDWKLPGVLVAWLNPPFADIRPWAAKCESVRSLPRWTLLLVPASVDAEWYWDHVHNKSFVAPLRGRLKFVGADDVYPKSLMLAAFGFGVSGFDPWRWRDGKQQGILSTQR